MKKITAILLLLALLLGGCTFEYVPPTTGSDATVLEGETLSVHFLDVGQADCILLECGGEFMIVDGGNADDGQMVVSYLLEQGVEELNTVICTHPHEDHVGGLPDVLATFPAHTILAPTTTYASGKFDDFMYYAEQQGVPVEIPEPGDTFHLGDDSSGALVTVLGPVKSYAEFNDTSIVVRVDFGKNSFLLTGDMETAAETDMLDYWENTGTNVDADVLKVGHHGSYTSTSYRFLREVSPTYAVISLGYDNPYGHPHDLPMSRLKQAGTTILRTDELGTIVATSDGTFISFQWERDGVVTTEPPETEPRINYLGDTESLIFHAEGCPLLDEIEKPFQFYSYVEAVTMGYTPCESCLE